MVKGPDNSNIEMNKSEVEADHSLPFTYERVYDLAEAEFNEWRTSKVRFNGENPKSRTDEEILKVVKNKKENQQWYTHEYWREKRLPQEQIEFEVNGVPVTVYNFNREISFTDEHIR